MVKIEDIKPVIEQAIENTDAFIVDIEVSADNDVTVEIDSPTGVDLDFCELLTRKLQDSIPESEDYSLEVGSSSLSAPFKVPAQYIKHIDDPVEVLTADGRKLHGRLSAADNEGFTLITDVKEKIPGEKRPRLVEKEEHFPYTAIKEVKYQF